MPRKIASEKKAAVLKRVAEIGAAAAAREAGVSYQSVLKWAKEGAEKVTAIPGDTVEKIDAQIKETEEKIGKAEGTLKVLKAELKALQKAKAKAEKEQALINEAENKKQVVEAFLKSGKSVEEVLEFLN